MPMPLDHELLDASFLLEKARCFAREQVAARVLTWERERRIGREAIRAAARIGLCAIEVPREHRGPNLAAELLQHLHHGLMLPLARHVERQPALAVARLGSTPCCSSSCTSSS